MHENVIQLRRLMAERFPHLRNSVHELPDRAGDVWPTGLPPMDGLLDGGLPRGCLNELVVSEAGAGGATLMVSLLRAVHAGRGLAALIDGMDSFDPSPLDREWLDRLLWARCADAEQALKAADLLLRDGNLSLLLLDLQINPEGQLRRISSTVWHRLQRLAEQTSAVCLVLTPRPMVAAHGAGVRLVLSGRFGLREIDREQAVLAPELALAIAEERRLKKYTRQSA